MIDQGPWSSFKVQGPVTTSYELEGPGAGGGGVGCVDSYNIKIYFTIIVMNSKCIILLHWRGKFVCSLFAAV